MVYLNQLPKMSDLHGFCRDVKNFPVSGAELVSHAEKKRYSRDVIDFIGLFSKSIVFKNRTDFLSHCSLLEQLIKDERRASPEQLRSPQD